MSAERGIPLAWRRSGERALPVQEGNAMLTLDCLRRHMLVCGATGSGKTETLLRTAWGLAKLTDAQVLYLDGKGDTRTAERFCALMTDAGRRTRVFPNEPFDAWRGEAHEIHGRLMEIVDYAQSGAASWYRDVAKTVLRLACEHPDGPPRRAGALLERLDLAHLQRSHGSASAAAALTKDQVRDVRLRYEAFMGQTRRAIDGDWAWEDASAAYMLLDSLSLKEETAGLSRLLLEDFAHYFTRRKPRERLCLLIVDEFSSLAGGGGMAQRIEQARGFNAALILAPQVTAGLGDTAEAERIVGSVETIVCHRVNTPESLIRLAGTRRVAEHSTRYGRGAPTGEGTLRFREEPKIDANKVRALRPGEVYVIRNGRAMAAQMMRAPEIAIALPKMSDPADAAEAGGERAYAGGYPAGETGRGGAAEAAEKASEVVSSLRF